MNDGLDVVTEVYVGVQGGESEAILAWDEAAGEARLLHTPAEEGDGARLRMLIEGMGMDDIAALRDACNELLKLVGSHERGFGMYTNLTVSPMQDGDLLVVALGLMGDGVRERAVVEYYPDQGERVAMIGEVPYCFDWLASSDLRAPERWLRGTPVTGDDGWTRVREVCARAADLLDERNR